MKKINYVLYLVLILSTKGLLCQDLLDPPKLNVVDTSSSINRSSNFFLGWNWGSEGLKLDSALNINFYHNAPYGSTDIKHNLRSAEPVPNIVSSRGANVILNAMSLQYEPTLDLDDYYYTGKFTPREGDTQGGVFGFLNRSGTYNVPNSGPNFNKIVFSGTTPSTVLDFIETGTSLRYLDYDAGDFGRSGHQGHRRTNDRWPDLIDEESDILTYYPFNGKQFYLSINLNAINADSLLNHLNDTLLVLDWGYRKITIDNPDDNNVIDETYGWVKFDRVPANDTLSSNIEKIFSHQSVTDSVFRGYAKNVINDFSQPTRFYITGNMIYNSMADSINSPITVSAMAQFTGRPATIGSGFRDNPHLKPDWWKNCYALTEFIDLTDVLVTYTGKADLAIDWIRIETPRAQQLFRGKFDDTIRKEVTTLLNAYSVNTKSPKIHRFYVNDEILNYEWMATRYFNMLVDTLAATELSLHDNPVKQYQHSTLMKSLWDGNAPVIRFAGSENQSTAVPYVKQAFLANGSNHESFQTMKYTAGYAGGLHPSYSPHNYIVNDTLNSDYETQSVLYGMYGSQSLPIFWNKPYLYDRKYGQDSALSFLGVQSSLERSLYISYYETQDKIFGKSNWWSNTWPSGAFQTVQTDSLTKWCLFQSRQSTGEELRYSLHFPVCMGAKGLVHWLKTQGQETNSGTNTVFNLAYQMSAISSYQSLLPSDELALIYCDTLGGDYVNIDDETYYNWKNRIDVSLYDWNTMGIDSNHIYIGLKSKRAETYKLHKHIKANENTLMNLELKSWLGKGHCLLFAEHPEYHPDTLLNRFIDIHNIKTKKLFQPNVSGGYNAVNWYENHDSSFYDITLLKDKSSSMDTTFYITVSNRRTDPLVWRDIAEPTNVWNLDFIPTARFDELVRSNDSTYWQDLWWKRLGAREITIPLNYTFTSEPNETTFKITELGAEDTTYMKNWWLGSKYHHTIDTAIYKNGDIVVRLLPGEGKILKVEISRKPQPFNGDLTYSNQRKLIAYPLVDTVNSVFRYSNPKSVMKTLDTVVYHLTYQRSDSIFYAQSFPMHKDFPTEHIDWRHNFHISKPVAIKNTVGVPFDNDTNGVTFIRKCKNPTIVVRKDSVETDITAQTKAYICYTCEAHFVSHGYWKPVIVENILPVNNPALLSAGVSQPRLLSTVLSDTNSTVTINASYNGNFYAWSDTLNGIVAAWKSPHAVRFADPILHKITIKGESASTRFRHPSLNTYSRVQLEECNSALVWQEFNNVYPPLFNTNIYYTRLQLDNSGQLYHYVTKTKCDTFPNYNFKYSADSNSLVITNTVCLDNKLPMVYRGVENNVDYFTPAYNSYDFLRSLKYDRIYWQGKNWNNIDNVIYYAGVDNFDTRNSGNRFIYDPDCMRNMNPSLLRRRFYTLKEPNIAQGEMYGYYDVMGVKQYKNVNLPSGILDKNLVLNFTEIDDNTGVSGIWHVPHGYFTLISDWSIFTNNFTGSNLPRQLHIDSGRLPHLAALPYMNDDKTMNLGRRIYNGVGGRVNDIESSLEYFYKGERKKEPVKLQYFGYEDGENITLISPVMVRGVIPLMNNNSVFDFDEKALTNSVRDTIKSDWLVVNDIEDIEFVSEELNNKTMRMQVEVEGNDELFEIQISKGNTAKLNKMRIINGENTKVRFVWTKVSQTSRYQEQIVLIDDVVGRFYKTTENQRNMVFDLGINTQKGCISSNKPLSLFPSPVDDELFITLNLPQVSNNTSAYKYNILNIYGQVVFTSEISNKVTETVNTSNLSNGTYFINFINLDDQTELIDKSNVFIINR